ncbi:MAG TPA: TrmO family methyltransferase [Puia sp.]|nr:TrmO family methyltransferase [Puia sp.]
MEIKLKPVAWVKNNRTKSLDDDWGPIISEIVLADEIPDIAFQHILDFSQLEIIYYFDKVTFDKNLYVRRPRGNPDYPEMGIFAQRNKDRPNQIGLSTGGINLAQRKIHRSQHAGCYQWYSDS